MRSLQIRGERKPGIPASFIHKGALCNFNSSRLVSIHSVLHLRRGRFTTNAKLAPQSSVLCIGLIFLSPPKKQLVYCKANGCRLTNSKQNPDLEAKPPRVLQKQQSVLWRGRAAIFGAPGLFLLAAPRTDLCLHRVLCTLAKFRVPSGPEMCAVFCFPWLPRAGRGIKPHPERATCPPWRRIWHGGANVPNKTITVGKHGSPFSDGAHLNASSPCRPMLRLYKLAKRKIFALISLP